MVRSRARDARARGDVRAARHDGARATRGMDAVFKSDASDKPHRAPRAGAKREKKALTAKTKRARRDGGGGGDDATTRGGNNPRAFIFSGARKAKRARTVAIEKAERKLRAPVRELGGGRRRRRSWCACRDRRGWGRRRSCDRW